MKVLSVEWDGTTPGRSTIWISEARILSAHGEPSSVLLAVDGTVHDPNSD
jgi:hypothetical protein